MNIFISIKRTSFFIISLFLFSTTYSQKKNKIHTIKCILFFSKTLEKTRQTSYDNFDFVITPDLFFPVKNFKRNITSYIFNSTTVKSGIPSYNIDDIAALNKTSQKFDTDSTECYSGTSYNLLFTEITFKFLDYNMEVPCNNQLNIKTPNGSKTTFTIIKNNIEIIKIIPFPSIVIK